MRSKMRRHADGKCQTCPQEDETAQHFLMECPAKSSLRRAIRDKTIPLELSSMLSNTASVELIYQWIYKKPPKSDLIIYHIMNVVVVFVVVFVDYYHYHYYYYYRTLEPVLSGII